MGLAIFIGYKIFSGSINGEHSTLNDQNMDEVFIDESSSDSNQSAGPSVEEKVTEEVKNLESVKSSHSHKSSVVKDEIKKKKKTSSKEYKKKKQNINKKSKKSPVRK